MGEPADNGVPGHFGYSEILDQLVGDGRSICSPRPHITSIIPWSIGRMDMP